MINKEGLNDILEDSKDYLETKIEITKLEIAEKSSEGISLISVISIFGVFVLILLISLSLSLGFLLSEYFESFAAGFGILSLFYFVVLIILILLRKKYIFRPIQNLIIREFFRDEQSNN